MIAQKIAENIYCIPYQKVNMFLIVQPEECILIDTGFPNSADTVLQALKELGKKPSDIKHILLTHAHPDHIGSATVLKNITGAKTYIHPLEAEIAKNGGGFRPIYAAPGLINWFMKKFVLGKIRQVDPVAIDFLLKGNQVLTNVGNIKVIPIPGHCEGQVAFLYPQHGGVLFMADSCMNIRGLVWTFVYEDFGIAKQSLQKLAQLSFEIAGFGHGESILSGADVKFRTWVKKMIK